MLTLERDLDYLSGLAARQLGDSQLAQRFWKAAAAPLPALSAHSYFQAQALRALGGDEAARAVLSDLAEYAARQAEAKPKIDYFATSLPNLLLFDDDLDKRNRIDSLLLSALANHGLGDSEKAIEQFREVIAEDPNHVFAIEMLGWLKQSSDAASEALEGSPTS